MLKNIDGIIKNMEVTKKMIIEVRQEIDLEKSEHIKISLITENNYLLVVYKFTIDTTRQHAEHHNLYKFKDMTKDEFKKWVYADIEKVLTNEILSN